MSAVELRPIDRLAISRTGMAAERTLIAWVRTALSMISFGFTIYQFLHVFQEQSTVQVIHPSAPRSVGLTLIGIGTSALALAGVQYRQRLHILGADRVRSVGNLAFVVACLLFLLGLSMFVSILFGSAPFG
jgi:putative membrane protein